MPELRAILRENIAGEASAAFGFPFDHCSRIANFLSAAVATEQPALPSLAAVVDSPDRHETGEAIARLDMGGNFHVPPGSQALSPKTPTALNATFNDETQHAWLLSPAIAAKQPALPSIGAVVDSPDRREAAEAIAWLDMLEHLHSPHPRGSHLLASKASAALHTATKDEPRLAWLLNPTIAAKQPSLAVVVASIARPDGGESPEAI